MLVDEMDFPLYGNEPADFLYNLSDLNAVEKIKTPCYLFGLEKFSENYTDFLGAFKKYYKDVAIAYSYKTNYARPWLQANFDKGGYAEVVSGWEYRMAREVGHSGSHIFFNGPHKTDNELHVAVDDNAVVNVDSHIELIRLRDTAASLGKQARVGVRVNFPCVDELPPSRFGTPWPSDTFNDLLRECNVSEHLKLVSLHTHYAPRSGRVVRSSTESIIQLAVELFEEQGISFEFISLGGGFYSSMPPQLAARLDGAGASFEDYARECAEALSVLKSRYPAGSRPRIVLEPGTALVADAVSYVCRVVGVKGTSGGAEIAVTDGSAFAFGRPPANKSDSWVILRHGEFVKADDQQVVDFVGFTCVENDVLASSRNVSAQEGDILILGFSGAYSMVMRPPFIRAEECVYGVTESGELILLRGSQDLGSLTQGWIDL